MVSINMIIAGVGGQGVVLAGDIIADAALAEGYDVKKTDTLGMAQRGGSVVTHLRIGDKVASPLISEGQADIMLAFEKVEAARWSAYLREGASVIVNDLAIAPLSVSLGTESYPGDDELFHIIRHRASEIMLLKGTRRAVEMGNSKVLNVLMLGALSMLMPFNPEKWQKAITDHLLSKIHAINLAAFEQGRRDMLGILSSMPGEYGSACEAHGDDCGCH
jgi:indolepyruvate ferredoxin oxidoreductase beta subunit